MADLETKAADEATVEIGPTTTAIALLLSALKIPALFLAMAITSGTIAPGMLEDVMVTILSVLQTLPTAMEVETAMVVDNEDDPIVENLTLLKLLLKLTTFKISPTWRMIIWIKLMTWMLSSIASSATRMPMKIQMMIQFQL